MNATLTITSPPGCDLDIPQLLAALEWNLGQWNLDNQVRAGLKAPHPREYNHKEVVQKIAAVDRTLNLIRAQNNAIAPINRLPIEILIYIFCIVQQRDDLLSLFPPAKDDELEKPAWFSVLHVCSHWRQIIMQCPSFWTHIRLNSNTPDPAYMRDWFAHHSGTLLIHLDQALNFTDYSGPSRRKHINSLKEYLSRPSDLLESIHISSLCLPANVLEEVLNQRFPALTSLHIELPTIRMMSEGILPTILGGMASNVKRLSLKYIVSWPNNDRTFNQVTHLSLRSQNLTARLLDFEFLEMLKGLPLLEVLHLEDAGPNNREGQFIPEHVSLNYLRRIEIIHSDESPPKYFLPYLDLPPIVHFIYRRPEMFERQSQDFRQVPPLSYRQTAISLELRCSTGIEDDYQLDTLSLYHESLCFDTKRATTDRILYEISKDFHNITQLIFSSPLRTKKRYIKRLLGGFPLVSSIRIDCLMDYLPLMDTLRGSDDLCPNLTELVVCKSQSMFFDSKIKKYEERRVTIIERSTAAASYNLVVQDLPK